MAFAEPFLREDALRQSLEEGRVYVMKDGSKTLSLASFSFFPMETIFPDDARAQNDLLDGIGYYGEPLLLLEAIFTDPFAQGKGCAKSLFSSLSHKHKAATWFALLPSTRRTLLPFFHSLGFKPYDFSKDGSLILVKKKEKEGLCAKPSF